MVRNKISSNLFLIIGILSILACIYSSINLFINKRVCTSTTTATITIIKDEQYINYFGKQVKMNTPKYKDGSRIIIKYNPSNFNQILVNEKYDTLSIITSFIVGIIFLIIHFQIPVITFLKKTKKGLKEMLKK